MTLLFKMINNTKTVDIPLSTLDRNRDDDSESDESELDEPQLPSTTEVQIDPVSYFRKKSDTVLRTCCV